MTSPKGDIHANDSKYIVIYLDMCCFRFSEGTPDYKKSLHISRREEQRHHYVNFHLTFYYSQCLENVLHSNNTTTIITSTMASSSSSSSTTEPQSRRALRTTRRILIKAGTSVVANDDGRPSLIRLSAICEQIAELQRSGVQIIMVSSGATGMGKRLLRTKSRMSMSIAEVTEQVTNMMMDSTSNSNLASLNEEEEHNLVHNQHHRKTPPPHHGRSESLGGSMLNGGVGVEDSKKTFQSACAAGGQFEMM